MQTLFKCPKCQYENTDNALVCRRCGAFNLPKALAFLVTPILVTTAAITMLAVVLSSGTQWPIAVFVVGGAGLFGLISLFHTLRVLLAAASEARVIRKRAVQQP